MHDTIRCSSRPIAVTCLKCSGVCGNRLCGTPAYFVIRHHINDGFQLFQAHRYIDLVASDRYSCSSVPEPLHSLGISTRPSHYHHSIPSSNTSLPRARVLSNDSPIPSLQPSHRSHQRHTSIARRLDNSRQLEANFSVLRATDQAQEDSLRKEETRNGKRQPGRIGRFGIGYPSTEPVGLVFNKLG